MVLARRTYAALLAATALSVASSSFAQTNWQANPATPDDWFDNVAWSSEVPSASQPAYISNGGEATISDGNAAADDLYIGNKSYNPRQPPTSGSGLLAISGGQLDAGEYLYDGYAQNSVASVIQSSGQISAANLYVADLSYSTSIYQLSGSGQLVANYEYIGGNTYHDTTISGAFVQTGGSNTTDELIVANGSYSVSGSSVLNASTIDVGGAFTQTGVTITTSSLSVRGYNGSYSVNSGIVNLTSISPVIISGANGATFYQTNSICNFGSARLYIGYGTYGSGSSNGTYIMSGDSQLFAGNLYVAYNTEEENNLINSFQLGDNSQLHTASEYIGYAGQLATFTQTGGINNVSGTFYMGYGGPGQYTLSGGVLTTGDQYIGRTESTANQASGADAAFVQSGGTNNLGIHTLYMGAYNSTVSYSLLTSGTLLAANEYVGSQRIATFNQSGGTNITGSLNVGFFIIPNVRIDGDDGSYNLSGGSLSAEEENIGYMGTIHNTSDYIVFTQTGGTNLTSQLNIAGEFNLSGGTLQITDSLLNNGAFDLQDPASAGLSGTNTLTLAPLPITGTGTLIVEQNTALYAGSITQGSLIIGGKIQIGPGSATSKINSLTVTTGTLDITNNALIIDYAAAGPSPLSTIRSYLYSSSAANQTGPGIISSTTLGDSALAIGYAEAASLGVTSFGGVAVDSTAVLIRFTWIGDANLDGIVNNTDLAMIQSNGTSWSSGDFNYDGIVNADDFALFALGSAEGSSTVIPLPEPAFPTFFAVSMICRWRTKAKFH